MPNTNSRLFDELAKVMSSAASATQGLRKEFDTLVATQSERVINKMNLVRREDFEVVKDLAQKAREENTALAARLEALEKKLAQ